MTRGKSLETKFKTSVESVPGLVPDQQIVWTRYKVGLLEFTLTTFTDRQQGAELSSKMSSPPKVLNHLTWQLMNELDTDHGMGATYGVLLDPEHGSLERRRPQDLEVELETHLGSEVWTRLKGSFVEGYSKLDRVVAADLEPEVLAEWEAGLREEYRTFEDLPNWEVLLRALWADYFAEPFSAVWLAAMAQHAYYFAQEDYAFGYLTALLDQRLKNKEHFERGVGTRESAARGGQVRAAGLRKRTTAVLNKMTRLVEDGHSVRRAAALAHQAGLGASADANRQLWKRAKTPPNRK